MNFRLNPESFRGGNFNPNVFKPVRNGNFVAKRRYKPYCFSIMRTEWILVGILGFGVLLFCGCNRAAVRFYGASTDFPRTTTGFASKTNLPYTIVVTMPVDRRVEHHGEKIAGTKWKACSTDAIIDSQVPSFIQQRLVEELKASGIFAKVVLQPTGPDDIIMNTEVDAFCSQAIGVIYLRVAGMSSLHVVLKCNGKTFLDEKFEKVVTDADPEYTGSQLAFIQQAMRVTMADSLRELMKNMLGKIENETTLLRKSSI
jgi:hypothetical protein